MLKNVVDDSDCWLLMQTANVEGWCWLMMESVEEILFYYSHSGDVILWMGLSQKWHTSLIKDSAWCADADYWCCLIMVTADAECWCWMLMLTVAAYCGCWLLILTAEADCWCWLLMLTQSSQPAQIIWVCPDIWVFKIYITDICQTSESFAKVSIWSTKGLKRADLSVKGW